MMHAQSSPQAQAAAKRLAKVTLFAFGGVGYAGQTSAGEVDYHVVLSESPQVALTMLLAIYSSGTAEARGYALVGIKQLSAVEFTRINASVSKSKEKIMTAHGCILTAETLASVAKKIEEGQPL